MLYTFEELSDYAQVEAYVINHKPGESMTEFINRVHREYNYFSASGSIVD